jgi:hypothetical protein
MDNGLSRADAQLVVDMANHANTEAFEAMKRVINSMPAPLQLPALLLAVDKIDRNIQRLTAAMEAATQGKH